MGYLGNQITTVFPTSISVDSATISGNASVGGTLGVTGVSTLSENIVFDASGKGVHLGVTSATASNLLDDYEEGTFTPAINSGATGGSYTDTGGNYTKIGNMVTFTARIQPSGWTGNSDGFNLSGLPFTSATGVKQGGAFFNYHGNFEDPIPTLHVGAGNTLISFFAQGGAGLTGNAINNLNVTIHIQGFYYTG